MKRVESAILSTDLAMYFKKRSKFLELVENGEFDWQSEDKKECKRNYICICSYLPIINYFVNTKSNYNMEIDRCFISVLCGMMMTACDVSAIAKPWDVQHRVAKLVADEFFDQGDLEKLQLKEQPVVSQFH